MSIERIFKFYGTSLAPTLKKSLTQGLNFDLFFRILTILEKYISNWLIISTGTIFFKAVKFLKKHIAIKVVGLVTFDKVIITYLLVCFKLLAGNRLFKVDTTRKILYKVCKYIYKYLYKENTFLLDKGVEWRIYLESIKLYNVYIIWKQKLIQTVLIMIHIM